MASRWAHRGWGSGPGRCRRREGCLSGGGCLGRTQKARQPDGFSPMWTLHPLEAQWWVWTPWEGDAFPVPSLHTPSLGRPVQGPLRDRSSSHSTDEKTEAHRLCHLSTEAYCHLVNTEPRFKPKARPRCQHPLNPRHIMPTSLGVPPSLRAVSSLLSKFPCTGSLPSKLLRTGSRVPSRGGPAARPPWRDSTSSQGSPSNPSCKCSARCLLRPAPHSPCPLIDHASIQMHMPVPLP